VTLHILAALLWLGGMFFLALVGAPVLRTVEPPALRVTLFRQIGQRSRRWGWISIGILLVTGTTNLWARGFLAPALTGGGAFWGTALGHALAWKLSAVGIMVAASTLHDFVLGPMASRTDVTSPRRERIRRAAALLARMNAVVGVVLVYWAVRLARGG